MFKTWVKPRLKRLGGEGTPTHAAFDRKFERLMPVFRRYTAEHIDVTIFLEHRSTMGRCPVNPWG